MPSVLRQEIGGERSPDPALRGTQGKTRAEAFSLAWGVGRGTEGWRRVWRAEAFLCQGEAFPGAGGSRGGRAQSRVGSRVRLVGANTPKEQMAVGALGAISRGHHLPNPWLGRAGLVAGGQAAAPGAGWLAWGCPQSGGRRGQIPRASGKGRLQDWALQEPGPEGEPLRSRFLAEGWHAERTGEWISL